ncbi:MAG: leucine-rich repeat domain-containing protein, partial [Clostridia bacterium]|nr:leucine-rich repeat domain-containing protein [Clostridia bacterium]
MKKQILSFVLVLCLISTLVSGISITASASSSGTCGENLTWTLDDEGTFTISGTGDMTDFLSDSDVPWYRLTWEIKTVVIKDGVTSIGDGAFSSCSNLTSITIPENVTIIGDGAFERCYRLETVTIGNKVISIGDSAFEFCNSLNSIIIPDSVTSIGSRAFYGCRSLASIIIPDGVTSIGRYSFSGCGSLAFVKIGKGVTSVGEWLHDDIDNFDGCDSLVSIEVSEDNLNYSSQDGVLFDKGKKKLLVYPSGNERTAYTIPDSVTSIGDRAFENCKNLASVTIGNGVTSIDEGTFNSCDNLAYIAIGSGVTDIYDNIFSEFANLETIKVSENNPYFSSQDGVLFDKDKKTILIYPRGNKRTTYTIPNSVTSIGDEEYGYSSDYSVFYHCSNLSRVTIPDSVTRIGGWAFLDCTDLASVTIGSGVTYIGPYAFGGCSSLTTIEVSENNPNYSSQDGVLFDKGKKKLLVYPSGNERTEYTIP